MVRTGRPPRVSLGRRVSRLADVAAGYAVNVLLLMAVLAAVLAS